MPEAVDRARLIEFVNQLLYETPGGMRFTQDSPVLTNVWLTYALEPRSQQKLILTLSRNKSAGAAADELRAMLARLRERVAKRDEASGITRERARISYIPGQISAELYFDEMMRLVLPLTPWWKDTYTLLNRLPTGTMTKKAAQSADWAGFPLPSEDRIIDMVDGLLLMRREIREEKGIETIDRGATSDGRRRYLREIPVDFLWLVRLSGLIGDAFLKGHGLLEDNAEAGHVDRLGLSLERDFVSRRRDPASGERLAAPREQIAHTEIHANRRRLAESFCEIYRDWTVDNEQPKVAFIWRVTKNRPVELAVHKSALTVKADAARRLFDVSCKDITWAVIDSGIDGRHPAFRFTTREAERAAREGVAAAKQDGRGVPLLLELLPSRVKKTLDFTHLRELLDYDVLTGASTEAEGDRKRLVENLRRRLRRADASEEEAGQEVDEHLDRLRDRIKRRQDVDWQDLEPLLVDLAPLEPKNDHGTHVAGVLGADWIEDIPEEEDLPLALRTRRMQGICPDIELIDVRVFRDDGKTDEFELLAAIQFLRWMNSRAGYMVVHGANLSLSLIHEVRRFACGQTPICDECNEASALGMVIVAAAGNRGFEANDIDHLTMSDGFRSASITDPGNAENVITVGATHRKRPHEYGVSYFSSRGPTGDGRVKPDLVAPGEKIKGPTPDGGAEFKDGTSMAAPHVSGAAAMLMARHHELVGNPARIKKILCETATDLNRERYYQGHGLLDILRALQSV